MTYVITKEYVNGDHVELEYDYVTNAYYQFRACVRDPKIDQVTMEFKGTDVLPTTEEDLVPVSDDADENSINDLVEILQLERSAFPSHTLERLDDEQPEGQHSHSHTLPVDDE